MAYPLYAEVSENLLQNSSFEGEVAENGIPSGWSLYGDRDDLLRLSIIDEASDGEKAVFIEDDDASREIGINQRVEAHGDEAYEASVMVAVPEGETASGAYIQLRFHPANKFFQRGLSVPDGEGYRRISVKGMAPEDTESAVLYLYTHKGPTPKVMVDDVSLKSGVEPPPPPPPDPVPPQYETLKELHLHTAIVRDGEANAVIVAPESGLYDDAAQQIRAAIDKACGVTVPVVEPSDERAAVPVTTNIIALGNRSTNATIEQLYNHFYCLLDLKYPGPGGHVVRTVHDPYGNGNNVIYIGGSDEAGVNEAADVFVSRLGEAEASDGSLTVGRLMDIALSDAYDPPDDVEQMEIWDASAGYGSTGYFGWNSISKHMAMYYMTGREQHAREALRLAFPDEEAKKQIAEIDGERIENKNDPLAGPYHYNAHMMILFWDLIEESPAFSDAERLKITNGFARQLNHRAGEGIYRLTEPPAHVGSRHGQWSAVSLYCLGRYFNKYYPNRIWEQCVKGAKMHFAPLHEHAWVSGESDNLFWYNTAIAPIFTYMVLTGDRKPIESGSVAKLLRGQEILIIGQQRGWALNSASIGYLHKAAYLTGDGRWTEYRNRTGMDTDVFRLGQSFWPGPDLQPELPWDLVNRWSIQRLPEPHWAVRNSGLPFDESFYFGSFRSVPDETGDFILIDGFNGASRNPYHSYAVLELRLKGQTILKGYRNQVLTRADGLVEPEIALNAALKHSAVVGDTALAVAEVPKASFCNWRRTLVHRTGQYTLFVDDMTFDTDSENMAVETLWETRGGSWDAEDRCLKIPALNPEGAPSGWMRFPALDADYASNPEGSNDIRELGSIDIVLLRATEPGDWLEMPFELTKDVSGETFVELVNYTDRGIVQISLDGEPVVERYNHVAPSANLSRISLGDLELSAGDHTLRVEIIEHGERSDRAYVGLSGLLIRSGEASDTALGSFDLCPSDYTEFQPGSPATLVWEGAVQQDHNRYFFTLLAPDYEDEGGRPKCVRFAHNAAALKLPEPALAINGEYEGTQADIAVMATDHIFGHNATFIALGDVLHVSAESPVDIDWDLKNGTLNVAAAQDTRITLPPMETLQMDGEALEAVETAAGGETWEIPAGSHTITGAVLATDYEQAVRGRVADAIEEYDRQQAAAQEEEPEAAPALTEAFTADVGEAVNHIEVVPFDDGSVAYVAAGSTVHAVAPDGQVLQTMEADDTIRVVHWWPEPELLLAGCVDEQVIAFDRSGERQWVFVSKMHPEVFERAKTYWFKSAPGHEGIHALETGEFIDGKPNCFVGSACTLEIIDPQGELVRRSPVFWGPGHKFQLIDGPEDTRRLLIARQPTDSEALAIISSETGEQIGRGFHSVPPGHSYVGSWAQMSRNHIFYEDLNDDGEKEVISEVNGVWNRITVWNEKGEALHNANFGPGQRIPYENMRDLDIADLDADGDLEIITGTSAGLVVALDHECSLLWSKRPQRGPKRLKAVTMQGEDLPWIFVACEDGSVVVYDGSGNLVAEGEVSGRPACIDQIETQTGPVTIVATNDGQIRGFTK
ncbi:MAG: hypothetical protein R6V19_01595 [Armatimonadota bacterium]